MWVSGVAQGTGQDRELGVGNLGDSRLAPIAVRNKGSIYIATDGGLHLTTANTTTRTSRMTKPRAEKFSKPENSGRKRRPTDPEPDQEVAELPGFGGAIEEEGVSPEQPELREASATTDVPAAETQVKTKRTIPGFKARAVLEIRSARRELAAAAAEVARLKDALAVRESEPSVQPEGGSRRSADERGVGQLTEAEKDFNRRALLAKCSEEFRRHDLTKVQSIQNPFSGSQGQDLDDFLVRFEVRANNCGWTEQDKVLGLAYHLDKGAALAYQRMIANGELADANFNDAVTYLRAKYPQASPSGDQLVTMFRNLRQRRGESVAEFAERFQSALARTERFQGPMSAAAVITRFRASLRDALRAQLRQVKLETLGAQPLNAMIAEATHMETQLLQEGSLSDEEEDEVPLVKRKRTVRDDELDDMDPRPQTAKRVVRALGAPEEPWRTGPATAQRTEPVPQHPAQEEIGHMLRQVKAIVETTQAVATRMQETQSREVEERARQARAAQGGNHPRRDPASVCFKCGRQGHWASECRNPRFDRDGQGRYDRREQQRGPEPYRGASRQEFYRPPPRYDGNRYQGHRDQRRPTYDRDHRREQPRDQPRDRHAAEPRQPRAIADEDRRALQRSAELLQGALQAAMAPAPTQNSQRPN
jgi:hypothetical protein